MDEAGYVPGDGCAGSRRLRVVGTSCAWRCCPRPDARARGRLSHTVRRWRPFKRRAFRIARPPFVFILLRNPCTRLRRRTLGCHVRFGMNLPHKSESQHTIIPNLPYPCKFLAHREIAAVLHADVKSPFLSISASAWQLIEGVC